MSDGKTAVLTRKSPLEKFASFCGSAAAWLAALVLFGLAAASLIARMDLLDVSTLAEGKALRVGISLPELLLFVVLTALLAGLCRLLRGLDDQKKTNRLIAGAAVLEFALALWWVFSQQIYPANDQETVWKMAEALASGDFSAYAPDSYGWTYFQTCPYQGAMALFMEPFIRLFGNGALRAWSLFGAISAPTCLLALCCIVREFGAKPRTQLLCAVLCLLFVPIPMYASFVYGTLPAPAMVLWGGYGLLRFIKGGKSSWLALPFVLFPLAVLAYQSALIFIIAVCIVAAFSGFGHSGKQLLRGLVLATLLLAVPVAVENIGQSVFFSRVRFHTPPACLPAPRCLWVSTAVPIMGQAVSMEAVGTYSGTTTPTPPPPMRRRSKALASTGTPTCTTPRRSSSSCKRPPGNGWTPGLRP